MGSCFSVASSPLLPLLPPHPHLSSSSSPSSLLILAPLLPRPPPSPAAPSHRLAATCPNLEGRLSSAGLIIDAGSLGAPPETAIADMASRALRMSACTSGRGTITAMARLMPHWTPRSEHCQCLGSTRYSRESASHCGAWSHRNLVYLVEQSARLPMASSTETVPKRGHQWKTDR